MTAGQRAMTTAMVYPEPEKGGRGKKASVSEGFSATWLSMARTILGASRPLADQSSTEGLIDRLDTVAVGDHDAMPIKKREGESVEQAFLLILTILTSSQKEDIVSSVYADKEMCVGVGEDMVKSTRLKLLSKGDNLGSVWFRCEHVAGQPITPPKK
jgi:hypothetical protein